MHGCLEHNPLLKKWRKGDKRVALVYPNSYASGIANIGLQQIYAEVNAVDGFVCERFSELQKYCLNLVKLKL